MKKTVATLVLIIICFCGLVACNQEDREDILHLGINAEIIEIDTDNQIVYVTDFGEGKVFGEKCAIDCKKLIEDQEILYVDYDTEEVSLIQFTDLTVGDKVTINAYESQLNCITDGMIEVEQIQLSTQRLNVD
ncbi:MAG: hypothetical protein IJP31_05390 [Lachnospiraceae bacterium]|nr:hypothetical protein [Lachnospiraceae bacterium]